MASKVGSKRGKRAEANSQFQSDTWQAAISDAAEASERFGDDELERYAAEKNAKERSAASPQTNAPPGNNAATHKQPGATMSASILSFSQDLATQEKPPVLPAGTYAAEIAAVERKTSQAGNPYLAVQFRITAEQYPADFDGDPDGTVLTYNRVIIPDADAGTDKPMTRWRMRQFLANIGASLSTQVDLAELTGLSANVVVEATQFEGEDRAEIRKVVAA